MMLSINKLAFGYPNHHVGQDVTLTVNLGEVLCLLGPNGSGKTTLFKTIAQLIKAQDGFITIQGENIAHWTRQRIAQALAYVPQQHDAYFPFTVLEVVLMGRNARIGLFSSPSNHDREIAHRALASLNIDYLSDAIYTRISGGERQLTLIARALAQETNILVLDEPTANLDFGNQVLVLNSIRRLSREGITIVMSTHEPDHAFQVASRVAMLKHGRIVGVGEPKDVITQESLLDLYGVAVSIVELNGVHRPPIKLCVPKFD